MEKFCLKCQGNFTANSGKQKFCSDKCKVAFSRMAKESSVITEIPKDVILEKPEIVPEISKTAKVETVRTQIAKENQYTPIPKEVIVKSADKTFPALLLRFNKLVEDMPKVSLIRAELDKISLDAYGSAELNYNQRSAIMERCSNYIKGDYGRKITA